jgi:hypothetical protein
MTFIVDESNAYYSEILKEASKLLYEMDAGMELQNGKIQNIKVSKRTFGDILDFQIQSKRDPSIKVEASIGVNKHLGIQNSLLIRTYCLLD